MSWFCSCWWKFWKAKSFGKNLIPERWAKMLLANQITGFLNQSYLWNKMMKKPFFVCWYRLIENRSWLRNIGVGLVQNGCAQSFLTTLKLAVCQEEMNEVNWFFVRWYKFMKAKSLTIFGWCLWKMGMVFKVLEL